MHNVETKNHTRLLPSLTLDRIQYRNYPEYIKAYEEYLENPENEELRNKMELEFNRATMSEEDFKEYLKFEEEINKKNTLHNNGE